MGTRLPTTTGAKSWMNWFTLEVKARNLDADWSGKIKYKNKLYVQEIGMLGGLGSRKLEFSFQMYQF